ncbi:MAG: hypothetical protein IPH69_00120 [Bacteroidales bacterium]|nr:hypothetical protein [Bacteroidales bacterium]
MIGSVPGLIGSLQATEVFKIILGLDGVLSGKIFMIDTLNFNTWCSSFKRNPELSAITELGEYEDSSLCNNYSVNEISADALNKLLVTNLKILIMDLRDKDDNEDIGFQTISVPHYDVSRKINLFDGYDAVAFYCRSGSRAISVINYLQKLYKLENLYSLVI